MKRILSIDGGGIRGIIPATVLAAIEERTHKPVAELFDVIAGTSTGGILACGLTAPGADGRPKFKAADLLDMYVKDGAGIFPRHPFQRVTALVHEQYPSSGIEKLLQQYVGTSPLSKSVSEVFVTAYDIERRKPKFFRSQDARRDSTRDHPVWKVARATSAAPTYFQPFRLFAADGTYEALVDGGVFANNPAMCAYVDGSTGPGAVHPDDVLLVSLGTGAQNRPIPYASAKNYGKLQWAAPILNVVFDGTSATIDYQLAQILGEGHYYRLETELTIASDSMDDVQPANIALLQRQAAKLIEDSAAQLTAICDELSRGLSHPS